MKKQIALLLAGISGVCSWLSGVDLSGYERVWHDDFSSGSLDPAYWTYDAGEGVWNTEANRELQYYTDRPKNVRVEDGVLVLEAHREDYERNGRYVFTSARVKTAGRMKFQYGILKARIRLPDLANGLWPAFWTLGDVADGWPQNGEIDILEAGLEEFIQAGTVNQSSAPRLHWCYQEELVDNPWEFHTYYPSPWNTPPQETIAVTVDSLQEFHDYILEWTETEILIYMDDAEEPFYRFTYDPEKITEFANPQALILNLAVGGSVTGIPNPADITAPFPARMEIDSVELWQKPGVGSFYVSNEPDARLDGRVAIGAFAEGTDGIVFDSRIPVDDDFGFIYSWNNLTIGEGTEPSEGNVSLSLEVPDAGQWFGGGIQTLSNYINFEKMVGGTLNLDVKTTSQAAFRVGIGSLTSGNGEVAFAAGEEKFGLQRDGEWHHVQIPLGAFGEIDLKTVNVHFFIVGDPPGGPLVMEIDNLYWEEADTELPTPENGSYGIYTETPGNRVAGSFRFGLDGEIFLWENTLTDGPVTAPSEGTEVMSFMSVPGLNWFGLGIFANRPLNLTAYENGALEFDMKTTSSVAFRVGMKSDMQPNIGQVWIDFPGAGSDPYGFVRDGQWHKVVIPVSDLKANGNLNLYEIVQVFQVLGVIGPIANLHLDNIYFSGGETARRDRWDVDTDPVEPEPVDFEDLFADATVEEGFALTWWGTLWLDAYPWVYHVELGWQYLAPSVDAGGVWAFDAALDSWIYRVNGGDGQSAWKTGADAGWYYTGNGSLEEY